MFFFWFRRIFDISYNFFKRYLGYLKGLYKIYVDFYIYSYIFKFDKVVYVGILKDKYLMGCLVILVNELYEFLRYLWIFDNIRIFVYEIF